MLRNIQRARSEESGFTLIELLIVIVILGILAGVVIFAVGGITDKGNVSACKSDLKSIQVAVEAYYAKNGNYPPDLEVLTQNPNRFLRAQPGLAEDAAHVTLVQAQGGYTVTYYPTADATHEVGDVDATLC